MSLFSSDDFAQLKVNLFSNELTKCLDEIDKNSVEIITKTIPNSSLHKFDMSLDRVLLEFNVIEPTHYSPRIGAEKQTVLLRGSHTPNSEGFTTYSTGTLFKAQCDASMHVERQYSLQGRIVLCFFGCSVQYELGHVVADFAVNGSKEKHHDYTIATRFSSDAQALLSVSFHPEGWVSEAALVVNYANMPKMRDEVERLLRHNAINEFMEIVKMLRVGAVQESVSIKGKRKYLQ